MQHLEVMNEANSENPWGVVKVMSGLALPDATNILHPPKLTWRSLENHHLLTRVIHRLIHGRFFQRVVVLVFGHKASRKWWYSWWYIYWVHTPSQDIAASPVKRFYTFFRFGDPIFHQLELVTIASLKENKPGKGGSISWYACFDRIKIWGLPSLKLTASLPLKIDHWKFGDSFLETMIFRGELWVSGRG